MKRLWRPKGLGWRTFALVGGAGVSGFGLLTLALGQPFGSLPVLIGLALLAAAGPCAYVIAVAGLLPMATIGWSLRVATIEGRVLDTRLVLTFGVAALSIVLAARLVRAYDWLDWLSAALVGYLILDGLLRTGVVSVWGPPAARWIVYAGTLIIARRSIGTERSQMLLLSAIAVGFLPTALAGGLQFLTGAANEQNQAIRATGFVQTSPIALAFAGQAMLFMLHPLSAAARTGALWLARLLGMILGAFAIIASATRIVLVTAFAGLAALAAWRRRWRELVLITVVFVGALAIRPDLLGRFVALAPSSPSSTPSSGSAAPTLGPQPDTGLVEGDTSLQYRIFVWRVLLRAWQATPVLGIGPGMAASTIEAVSPTSHRQAPHNDYIGTLTEAGVLGLLLLLLVQGAVLAQLWRRQREATGWEREAAMTVLIAFVMTDVVGVLNNPIYAVELQVGLWAAVGAMVGTRADRSAVQTN